MIHNIIKILALVLILFQIPVTIALPTLEETIDVAGKQRMLSQRIGKAYLMRGMTKIKKVHDQGTDQLELSINDFENNMKFIRSHRPSANKFGKDLAKVKSQWTKFKALAQSPDSNDVAKELMVESDKLLKLTHAYVKKLESLGSKSSEIVGISGKQRMLSQRVAKCYIAHLRGIKGSEWEQQAWDSIVAMESSFTELKDYSGNTPEIKKELRKAISYFNYMFGAMDGDVTANKTRMIKIATGTSEMVRSKMDIITSLYAEL